MTTLAHQIAERIHRPRYEDLTPAALEWTRTAFIDTVGCHARRHRGGRPAHPACGARHRHRPRPEPDLRHRPSAPARSTPTLVNGTASHALDYDDVSGVMGGHPSVMLIPPMIALAEQFGATGRDLALAYVVGYETECRIARGVHFHHYDKGWHPTATLGIFGTVAAAARLLRFTPDQTAMATRPRGIVRIRAESEFRHHDQAAACRPHAARNGLFAALMVKGGFTANPAALEAKQGFLDVFNGPGTYDIDRMLADWYAPLEVEGGGEPGLKPYPCCGSTHASINRMIHLARAHNLTPERVETIEVMPHAAPPAAHQQSRPAHAARARSSASSTWWRARWRIARCGWSISRATRLSIPSCAS